MQNRNPRSIPAVDYGVFAENIKKYHLTCSKLDIAYNVSDSRCWTALVNPEAENLLVTFHVNKYNLGDRYFDILSSTKSVSDIFVEDIYDSIDLIINKNTSVATESEQ